MPAVFGATVDDLIWFDTSSHQTETSASFVYGWWHPTTLTAGKMLWGHSNLNSGGAEIDATTSELRLRCNFVTDSEDVSSGLGLEVNKWQFLAFLRSQSNTGPAVAWRLWRGLEMNQPREISLSVGVAPAGTTSSGDFVVGNGRFGGLAFQGEIAHVGALLANGSAGATHPFGLSAYGAIADSEAEFMFSRFVLPAWKGDFSFPATAQSPDFETWHVACDRPGGPAFGRSTLVVGSENILYPTTTTTTFSEGRCPQGVHNQVLPLLVRR